MRVRRLALNLNLTPLQTTPMVKVERTRGEIDHRNISGNYAQRLYHPTLESIKRIKQIHKALQAEPFTNGFFSARKNGMIEIFAHDRKRYSKSLED